MKCSGIACTQDATWRAQVVRKRVMVDSNDGFCEEHAKRLWESYFSEQRKGVGTVYDIPGAAWFEIELVMAEYKGYSARALLREVGSTRLIFFPIGFVQSCELYWAVHGTPYNNLTIHAALKKLVEHVDGTLSHVLLDRFNPDGYFEAYAIILRQQEVIKLRIRPSDGLVLAMMTKLHFLVAEEVFSKMDEWGKWSKW